MGGGKIPPMAISGGIRGKSREDKNHLGGVGGKIRGEDKILQGQDFPYGQNFNFLHNWVGARCFQYKLVIREGQDQLLSQG